MSGYTLLGGTALEDRGNGASAVGGIESLPRFGLTDFDAVTGQLWISYVTAAASGSVSKLMVATGSAAATSVTLTRMALFTVAADGSLTKVAQTASQTGIGAATFTPYEFPLSTAGGFPASYTLTAGVRYALGYLQVATTAARIQGAFVLDGATAPVPSRVITGQSDIAASYAVGTLTPAFNMAYLRGRP